MTVYGYGEDALTYWALTTNFDKLKAGLVRSEELPDADYVRIYRPSFGRGERGFGEFDAIISTEESIYLIESKWDKSSELRKKKGEEHQTIGLSGPQIFRHKIFEELHKRWCHNNLVDFFREEDEDDPTDNINAKVFDQWNWKVCKESADLASNILTTFEILYSQKGSRNRNGVRKSIKNILLFFHSGEHPKLRVITDNFTLVTLRYCPLQSSNSKHFEMDISLPC